MSIKDMDESTREGVGCGMMMAHVLVFMAAAFVIGGIFGWYWGVGLFLGSVGLFLLLALSNALKE